MVALHRRLDQARSVTFGQRIAIVARVAEHDQRPRLRRSRALTKVAADRLTHHCSKSLLVHVRKSGRPQGPALRLDVYRIYNPDNRGIDGSRLPAERVSGSLAFDDDQHCLADASSH